MCTALIYRNLHTKEFGLGFNRDESFLRKRAELPRVYESNQIKVLAPKDGDHHGTWIGVNNKGDVYALLNLYEVKIVSIVKPVSRGWLVSQLLERKISFQDLNTNSLKNFLPFRLIFLTLEKTYLLTWDGRTLQVEEDQSEWQVYASSALHGKKAEVVRKQTFETNFLQNSPSSFMQISKDYLSCHIPEKGSLSPCMHRDVAHTVSQTILYLQNETAHLEYKDGQPCEEKHWTSYKLNLS